MNFYHDTTLKNDTVSGDGFPELETGVNNISFDGGITSVEIIPKWVSL
jgi:phage-related protein